MELLHTVLVLDAADLDAESRFWAHVLGGRVIREETWHSVIDAEGNWRLGIQLAPNHVAPSWPSGNQQQQVHLDLHAVDFTSAHDEVVALGARVLQAADDLGAEEGFQVYADPAGHPFCIGWGHPSAEQLARFLAGHVDGSAD